MHRIFCTFQLLIALSIAAATIAYGQTCPSDATDNTSFDSYSTYHGETNWNIDATVAGNSYLGGIFTAYGFDADGYTKCDCTFVAARWFSADTETFQGPNTGSSTSGGVTSCTYSLAWDFLGPGQLLTGCAGGACVNTGAIETTPQQNYDGDYAYWTVTL